MNFSSLGSRIVNGSLEIVDIKNILLCIAWILK
jgi:hypothetical protein